MQKFFITNFVTCITNFVICVTKFVTKTFLYDRKKYLPENKNYPRANKKYQVESAYYFLENPAPLHFGISNLDFFAWYSAFVGMITYCKGAWKALRSAATVTGYAVPGGAWKGRRAWKALRHRTSIATAYCLESSTFPPSPCPGTA